MRIPEFFIKEQNTRHQVIQLVAPAWLNDSMTTWHRRGTGTCFQPLLRPNGANHLSRQRLCCISTLAKRISMRDSRGRMGHKPPWALNNRHGSVETVCSLTPRQPLQGSAGPRQSLQAARTVGSPLPSPPRLLSSEPPTEVSNSTQRCYYFSSF